MRVIEHRQTIWLQRDDLVHRARETVRSLQRKAVYQVDVNRAELQGARRFDDGAGFVHALQAIDGALHQGVEVLHAQADAVEAQFTQQAHGRPVGLAGVDFDAVIAGVVVHQGKMLAQMRHQLTQFDMAEKSRRATTEVQLLDDLTAIDMAGDHLDFLLQTLQIGLRAAPVLGDDFIAGAVVANVGAERDVHVQRQRAHGLAAFTQRVQQIERTHLIMKLQSSGVGRITRSCQIVAADEFRIPTNVVEHAGIPEKGWR